MDLAFNTALGAHYKNASQKARVLTEDWVSRVIYCPNCGRPDVTRRGNNSRIGDFFCPDCREEFELKSLSQPFGNKVDDGAHRTMMARLNSENNPNLVLLHYDPKALIALNCLVIPKHFLRPDCIEARTPLSGTARRAGWIGCRILLGNIPRAGLIFVVRDQTPIPSRQVLARWKETLFLRDRIDFEAKGWLLDVMKCIDKIGTETFTLESLYTFEDDLKRTYPGNRHVRDKIRQQLQVLRDNGYLTFTGRGTYRLTPSD